MCVPGERLGFLLTALIVIWLVVAFAGGRDGDVTWNFWVTSLFYTDLHTLAILKNRLSPEPEQIILLI